MRGFFLIPLALAWLALSPTARAVSPAPDGGYSGNNTALGFDALYNNTTGFQNTAVGVQALFNNTAFNEFNAGSSYNTATGYQALFNNTTINGVSGFDNTVRATTRPWVLMRSITTQPASKTRP
ncbi:MAG: hypothetical protein DME50_13160 [Verrucomicrobia bacterium]|nr:MAG: hypothetical protein DME50_13160 [Verrucomicrobiota bacterium]